MKIILVGNSPTVLYRELGYEIDKFNIIVRLNDYKTIGYEKYVGSHTDILITNGNYIREYKDLSRIKEVFVSCRSFERNFQGIKNYIPAEIIHETDNLFHGFNNYKTPHKCPTTGLYASIFLLNRYNIPIYLYGINELHISTHYFNNEYKLDLTHHSIFLENQCFKYLLKLGKLIQL